MKKCPYCNGEMIRVYTSTDASFSEECDTCLYVLPKGETLEDRRMTHEDLRILTMLTDFLKGPEDFEVNVDGNDIGCLDDFVDCIRASYGIDTDGDLVTYKGRYISKDYLTDVGYHNTINFKTII